MRLLIKFTICVHVCMYVCLYVCVYFIYLFIYLFEIQQTYLHTNTKKYSEHKIVSLNINKHAARHCRALNLIKSRLLYATGYRH